MSEIGINSRLDIIDDIKKDKLKFNLLIGDKECRTLEEVKENFNIDDIKKYYDSGLLERWLLNNNYKDLYFEIKDLKSKVHHAYYYDGAIHFSKINIKKDLKYIFFLTQKEKEYSSILFHKTKYDELFKYDNPYYNYNDYKNYSTADEYFNNYKEIVNIIINNKTEYSKIYIDLLSKRYSYFFDYDYKNFIKKIMDNKNYYVLFYMFYNDFMREYLIKDDDILNFINEKIIKNNSEDVLNLINEKITIASLEKVNNNFNYIKYYSKSENNDNEYFVEISNKECIILYIENASVTSIDNKEKVYNKDDINNKFIKINGIKYNWKYDNKIIYIEM